LFRACALGLLHKRHARKHKILSDCSCKLKSIRFCAMTLTNRPAPLYTVGNLQAEPTYVVFMVPLAAPRNSSAQQVHVRTLTPSRSWYSFTHHLEKTMLEKDLGVWLSNTLKPGEQFAHCSKWYSSH
jgi:hypothetical protein